MLSSQERILKYINTIEKTINCKSKKTILHEYEQFLLKEINTEKGEHVLKAIQRKHESIECQSLIISCSKLQDEVSVLEAHLEKLKEEIDNLTIQSIAEKECFKRQEAEKESLMISFYLAENDKAKQELERVDQECLKAEQELKNQISLELATKNARLYEMKRNLQKQLSERKNEYSIIQKENRELRKQIDDLKKDLEKKQKMTHGPHTIPSQINTPVQENRNMASTKPNVPKPHQQNVFKTFDYTYLAPVNQLEKKNPYGDVLPHNNSEKYGQYDALTIKSPKEDVHSTISNELAKQNTDPKNSCIGDEYEQFERHFSQSAFNNTILNQRISSLKPNPCRLMANPGETLHPKSLGTSKDARSVTLKPKTSPIQNDNFELTDDLTCINVKQNDTFEDMSNAPRKLPTVYQGKPKKIKCTNWLQLKKTTK